MAQTRQIAHRRTSARIAMIVVVIIASLALTFAAEAEGQVVRQRAIGIDAGALAQAKAGDAFALELFDDCEVSGEVVRHRTRAPGRFTTSGMLTSDVGGTFVLAVNQGAVAGLIRTGVRGTFQVRGKEGALIIEQLDDHAELPCFTPDHAAAKVEGGAAREGEPCDDGSVIDVLVVFTPAAVDFIGGMDEMIATIDFIIEESNLAFAISEVSTSVNLVHAGLVDVSGPNANLWSLADPDDGIMDGVHTMRDAYGADLVALINETTGGVAFGLWSLTDPDENSAFSVSGVGSIMNAVFTHEIGHSLGCCHAWGDGGGCPAQGGLLFPYSNGHRFFGNSGTQWRTVMAYAPGVRLVRFSNPQLSFDGQPTGVPQDQPQAADNAATINQSALVVANHRCSNPICQDLHLPPDAPDCNGNGVPDGCDIAIGTSQDLSNDGIPDECCPADITGPAGLPDGSMDVLDLLSVINAWGPCNGCPQDINGNGLVNLGDIIHVMNNWGPCLPE